MIRNESPWRVAALVLLSVAAPALLGLLGLAPAFCIAIAVTALAIIGVIEARRRSSPAPQPWPQPPAGRPAPAPRPPTSELTDVPLDSNIPDYRFLFSASVGWRENPDSPVVTHADSAALARTAVIERAGRIAAGFAPEDHVLAQHELAAALGLTEADRTGKVHAWATAVRISLEEDDAERIATLARLRKSALLWNHERDFEREVRRYFGEEILTSTGSAVVWWLAQCPDPGDRVTEAVRLADTLQSLTQLAQDRSTPEPPFRAFTAADVRPANEDSPVNSDPLRWADDLFAPDDPQRLLFGHELARLLEDHGVGAQSDGIRDVFDVRAQPGPAMANDEQSRDEQDEQEEAVDSNMEVDDRDSGISSH